MPLAAYFFSNQTESCQGFYFKLADYASRCSLLVTVWLTALLIVELNVLIIGGTL